MPSNFMNKYIALISYMNNISLMFNNIKLCDLTKNSKMYYIIIRIHELKSLMCIFLWSNLFFSGFLLH
jgi:hypothetical protein